MQQGAAAVIDLEQFRRRKDAREMPKPAPGRATMPAHAAMPLPVWIVWVPVWTVA
jgi:hypothetical protein